MPEPSSTTTARQPYAVHLWSFLLFSNLELHQWIKGFLDWASIRPKRRSNLAQPAPYPLLTHTSEEASRETGSRWRRWAGMASWRHNCFSALLGSSYFCVRVGECRSWEEGDWAHLFKGLHSSPEGTHKENPLSLIHKFWRWFAWSQVSDGALVVLETPVVCCCCSCACVVQSRFALIVVDHGLVLGSPAAWCSSASQVGVVDVAEVGVVDVPLSTDFGSSISVNNQTWAAKLVFWDRTFVRWPIFPCRQSTCSELLIAPLDFTLFCAIC
jgi:hypothetical protein